MGLDWNCIDFLIDWATCTFKWPSNVEEDKMSIQIVGRCPICGSYFYTYPTYPDDFQIIHNQCDCYEITRSCFTKFYRSLEKFSNIDEKVVSSDE